MYVLNIINMAASGLVYGTISTHNRATNWKTAQMCLCAWKRMCAVFCFFLFFFFYFNRHKKKTARRLILMIVEHGWNGIKCRIWRWNHTLCQILRVREWYRCLSLSCLLHFVQTKADENCEWKTEMSSVAIKQQNDKKNVCSMFIIWI